jgi:hypothetical protein
MQISDAELRARMQSFVEMMLRQTVRLVATDDAGMPNGIASGFILNRGERNFVIAAGHSFWSGRQWAIETRFSTDRDTLVLPITSVQLFSRDTLVPGEDISQVLAAHATADLSRRSDLCYEDRSGEPLDIAWAPLDLAALGRALSSDPRLEGQNITLPAYRGPIDAAPSPGEAYGFAAWNRVELHLERGRLWSEAAYEVCMQYDGMDSRYDLYRFTLAREHRGTKYYKGSSGTPIADPTGRIVAIVVCGSKQEDIIFGFPLKEIAALLDLENG